MRPSRSATRPATVSYGPSGTSRPIAAQGRTRQLPSASQAGRPSSAGAAASSGGVVLGVVLVADLADELLDDVLQGDHAGGAAVLVDDDGDRLLAAQPLQQRLHGQRLRAPAAAGRRSGRPGCAAGRAAGHGEGVLEVDHADDLVDALAVDGEAGQAGGPGQVEHVAGGGRATAGR